MVERLSTNKPDTPKKPEIVLDYNDKSYQSYIEQGFADSITHKIQAPHDRIQQFLSQVDIRNGPIERTVTTMVRLRATDYDSPTHEKNAFTMQRTGRVRIG
jgi:ABC-type Fe2+-enterobactin transport system substrate-binding protein